MTDSVCFTCAVDAHGASIWVHWHELPSDNDDFELRYVSSEVDSYLFKRLDDIGRFHVAVRNIVDWGLGDRLTMIKKALRRLNENRPLPD